MTEQEYGDYLRKCGYCEETILVMGMARALAGMGTRSSGVPELLVKRRSGDGKCPCGPGDLSVGAPST